MYYSNNQYYLVPLTAEQIDFLRTRSIDAQKENLRSSTTSIDYQEQREIKDLYTPIEGLSLGNMFKDEYRGYKSYKPDQVKATNDKEKMMLDVMMYSNAAHDLALKLDIVPTDQDLLKQFEIYRKKANEAIIAYQDKYGPLTPGASKDNGEKYSYINTPSPWLK